MMIDEYLKKKHFLKWKTEKGLYENVIPIEFLSYIKNSNGYIAKFLIDNDIYEGQKWKCKLSDGSRRVCVFRVKVNPLDINEDSDEDIVEERNTIQIKPDLISGNSMLLKLQEEKELILIQDLKKKKDPKSKAHLRFLLFPSKKTYNDLLHWRKKG